MEGEKPWDDKDLAYSIGFFLILVGVAVVAAIILDIKSSVEEEG